MHFIPREILHVSVDKKIIRAAIVHLHIDCCLELVGGDPARPVTAAGTTHHGASGMLVRWSMISLATV